MNRDKSDRSFLPLLFTPPGRTYRLGIIVIWNIVTSSLFIIVCGNIGIQKHKILYTYKHTSLSII